MPTTETENKEIVRQLMDEVIGEGNLDVIDEFVADDIVAHSNLEPEPVHGLDEYKEFISDMRPAFSDWEYTVEDVIAEDDKVVFRTRTTGTHDGEFMGIEPTGQEVDIQGMYIARIEDGEIVESWGQSDLLAALQQLGVVELPGE